MQDREKRIEALAKLIDLGICRGAETLNTLLASSVSLETPSVKLFGTDDNDSDPLPLGEDLLAVVRMGFAGSLTGDSGLVFEKESALKLVERLAGDDMGTGDFDFSSTGVITEIGNIVLNSVLGSISNALKLSLDFVVPCFFQGDAEALFQIGAEGSERTGLLVTTRFKVEDLRAEGSIVLLLEPESYEMLMSAIDTQQA